MELTDALAIQMALNEQLKVEYAGLKAELEMRDAEVAHLRERVGVLDEQVRWLRRLVEKK
jgi:hypothetical protein